MKNRLLIILIILSQFFSFGISIKNDAEKVNISKANNNLITTTHQFNGIHHNQVNSVSFDINNLDSEHTIVVIDSINNNKYPELQTFITTGNKTIYRGNLNDVKNVRILTDDVSNVIIELYQKSNKLDIQEKVEIDVKWKSEVPTNDDFNNNKKALLSYSDIVLIIGIILLILNNSKSLIGKKKKEV